MEKEQKVYAKQRILSETQRKIEGVKEKHTKKGKSASIRDKLDAVREGTVDMLRNVHLDTRIMDAFDFSTLEPDEVFNSFGAQPEIDAIRRESDRIIDEIMLGDATKALAMIKKLLA